VSDFLRDPELDRLVDQLNSDPSAAGAADGAELAAGLEPEPLLGGGPETRRVTVVDDGEPLQRLLSEMGRRGASDLLLIPDLPPILRLDGRLGATSHPALSEEEIRLMFAPYLVAARARRQLAEEGSADFSLRLGGSGESGGYRFRVNLHRQRGRLAAALRALPREIPTLSRLNLPPALAKLVQVTRGLVLVCGPTGSGKSSTLAALLGEINRTRAAHILTIEDPVEYEYESRRCLIHQREVGRDVESFAAGLRAALRESPDVILVGEMRDRDTFAAAMTAAETGHLVFSTLHSGNAAMAIDRIVDSFPPHQQGQVRAQLANVLRAIVTQLLLPATEPGRLVPAIERMLVTHAVAHKIREGRGHQVTDLILTGRADGMVSLETSLADLVRRGQITLATARAAARNPDILREMLAKEGR